MAANATVDQDHFANNALTNLAPLLTLFGDEVTKQFLATFMGIPDAMILKIAPIGIMTVIVSAIRVGTSRLMKSIIGRARGSPDDEEKELLSSTSANVREIWTGNRVVRQTGASKTTVFMFNPNRHTNNAQGLYPRYGLISLSNHLEKRPHMKLSAITPKSTLRGHADIILPNITLNVQGAIPNERMVVGWAFIGLSLQALVLMIIAIVTYKWKLPRSGKVVASYGYPIWVTGTVAINLGISACGWAIGNSTRRTALKSCFSHDEPASIVLLQEAITEQNIPAYAIKLVEPNAH
ncbi:mfs general substrate transporter [Apiospora sp. TS-2023a]